MTEPQPARTRHVYLAAFVIVIACGLLWRRPEFGLPAAVAKFGGSVWWGAMVFFCVAFLMPRAKLGTVVVLAAIGAALVEASQLIRVEPLDRFRSTTFGMLLLGRTFSWWDIACYWAGIAAARLVTSIALRRKLFRNGFD
jgi:hypothetical protein